MANYCWILMEGLYLHNLVFLSMFTDTAGILKYGILGWGLPLFFIIPWIIVKATLEDLFDEAHFWLNGYVNKQNCRIWSEANPQEYAKTPLHPEKTDCLELWFQQDGATCHKARDTIDLLKDTFGDRLISRFGPVNWPPRSCDLTPLDYLLWGYVKPLIYADKSQTLDHLEDNIRRFIADIRPQMFEKVFENCTFR
ncbi:transposable element Tc3 transposase [Trichonephila clavipes]|nr:transposable element Tc3 transposase [Trichonephila clavipes]